MNAANDNLELYFIAAPDHSRPRRDRAQAVLEIARGLGDLQPELARISGIEPVLTIAEAERALQALPEDRPPSMDLWQASDARAAYNLSLMSDPSDPALWLMITAPLNCFDGSAAGAAHTHALIDSVRALSTEVAPQYGWAHSQRDASQGANPSRADPFAPIEVNEVYWLNIYGSAVADRIGRKRLATAPATVREDLPGGGILLLTRPTPVDYATVDARRAQAATLAALRPDLDESAVLRRLRSRGGTSDTHEPDV